MIDDDRGRVSSPWCRRRPLPKALVAFVVQNRDDVTVNWLFFDGQWPPVARDRRRCGPRGQVLSEVGGWVLRRRRRRSNG
ncbi:MAG: hypothetical protein R2695_21520 [Acidimicrobiales bacterium]